MRQVKPINRGQWIGLPGAASVQVGFSSKWRVAGHAVAPASRMRKVDESVRAVAACVSARMRSPGIDIETLTSLPAVASAVAVLGAAGQDGPYFTRRAMPSAFSTYFS
jgi:hypothetical protein